MSSVVQNAAGGLIQVGLGNITTVLPAGKTGLTDSRAQEREAKGDPSGDHAILPAVTADFRGVPTTNSIFTPLAYHQFDDFSSGWLQTDPMAFKTTAKGLAVSYARTPWVAGDGGGYNYDAFESLTLGIVGLNAAGTSLAAQSDWTATADWGASTMRATMVQGGLFTYVTRQSSADVTVDLHQANRFKPDTPIDPLAYTASGLTGSYDGGALAFAIPVDAGAHIGDGIQFRLSYDFDGDGKVDRSETFQWFGTDAGPGQEIYSSVGSRMIASTGSAMRDLANGSVKVELWRANGEGDVVLETNSAASFVKLPFADLTAAGVGTDDGKLFFQQGAIAAGRPSNLATAPGDTVLSDTTHVTPPPSIGGYTGPGQIWYQENGVVGLTINGTSYGIFGPPGSTWTYTAKGLQSNLGGADYYSVAVLPNASEATVEDLTATLGEFRKHAYSFVTGTTAEWKQNKATNTLTTDFTYQTRMMAEGADLVDAPLTALYQHQYNNSAAQTLDFTYGSPRGAMEGFAGKTFSTN